MAKETKEITITLEKMMEVADKKIQELPSNKIKTFLPVIEKLKKAGFAYKEIAEIFTEQGFEVKAYVVKDLYLEAHPNLRRNNEEPEQANILGVIEEEKEKHKKK